MSVVIDQEAWLAYYAERLGVDTANLGERDVRLALAMYHAIYLPTAATVEYRANELDLKQRYAEFGFAPNTPSFATATLQVELRNAATTTYTLPAPFVVRQGDYALIATTPLTIPAGQTTGTASVKAQLQGEAGTPKAAAAQITNSVAWLRGAAVTLTAVVPGRDGDSLDTIRTEFRAFATNPQALVRAEDHAAYIETNYTSIGRALPHPRTRIIFEDFYTAESPIAGHMSIALISNNGGIPTAEQVDAVKEDLLRHSVPYGGDALHIVPATPKAVSGTITAVIEPGLDKGNARALIIEALGDHLDWRTWPAGRDVYAGDMWRVVDNVPGIRYVNSIILHGDNPDVIELEPWQYPQSAFTADQVALTEPSAYVPIGPESLSE